MPKQELTQEQIDAINNYSDRIKTLKDFVTSVRTRPTMYIGSLFAKGLLNSIREVFQNSIDTILDPLSPGSWFSVSYNSITKEVIVEDNGTGLPPDDIIRILTKQHTSKNYEKRLGEYSAGYNGIGSKCVNALSDYYIVESYKYNGTAVRMEFNKGYPKYDKPKSIPNKQNKQGLKTIFRMDESIMGEMDLDWKILYNLIKHMISIMPIGSICYFSAIDNNGKEFKEEIINKDGIITNLIMKVKSPIIKPISIFADDGTHRLECAFCYDSNIEDALDVLTTSFCNMCPTISGTHVDGVIDGICKWFTNYMNNIYLINQKVKDKLKIIPNDVKSGLCIMISAAHLEPLFNDQSKEILGNPDMIPFCRQVIMSGLNEWSKSNPQDLAKISKFLKEIGELRMKQDKDKEKIVQKYTSSSATGGLPRNYRRPLTNKNNELIIVEGESALGNVETGRDPKTQGIFPIRGKIINAFSCTKEKFFNNEEVQSIMKIMFGSDTYRKFPIEECKVDKIIIMADGDIDGNHIASLIERMFIMYFPQVIADGRLYKALPPLYSVKIGNKEKYFLDNPDIVKYIQKAFLDKYRLTTIKNEALNNIAITKFFIKNADYTYYLDSISKTYAVLPELLEKVLINYVSYGKINFKVLQKELNSSYRFINVSQNNGSIVIDATIGKSILLIVNEKLINDCKMVLDILSTNDSFYYNINGVKTSIYDIMKLYKENEPTGIHRYKGLAEYTKQQLSESTLHPEGNRCLIQYTINDIKECLNTVREYESDTKKFLKLTGIVTRDDLMD